MATQEQMKRLLATPCRWCGVGPGERCRVRIGSRVVARPTTLDGESHETRWQDALGMPARVLSAELATRFGWRRSEPEPEMREPSRIAVLDRPW